MLAIRSQTPKERNIIAKGKTLVTAANRLESVIRRLQSIPQVVDESAVGIDVHNHRYVGTIKDSFAGQSIPSGCAQTWTDLDFFVLMPSPNLAISPSPHKSKAISQYVALALVSR